MQLFYIIYMRSRFKANLSIKNHRKIIHAVEEIKKENKRKAESNLHKLNIPHSARKNRIPSIFTVKINNRSFLGFYIEINAKVKHHYLYPLNVDSTGFIKYFKEDLMLELPGYFEEDYSSDFYEKDIPITFIKRS